MKANSKDRTAFTLVSSISIVTLLQTGKGNIDSKSLAVINIDDVVLNLIQPLIQNSHSLLLSSYKH